MQPAFQEATKIADVANSAAVATDVATVFKIRFTDSSSLWCIIGESVKQGINFK